MLGVHALTSVVVVSEATSCRCWIWYFKLCRPNYLCAWICECIIKVSILGVVSIIGVVKCIDGHIDRRYGWLLLMMDNPYTAGGESLVIREPIDDVVKLLYDILELLRIYLFESKEHLRCHETIRSCLMGHTHSLNPQSLCEAV